MKRALKNYIKKFIIVDMKMRHLLTNIQILKNKFKQKIKEFQIQKLCIIQKLHN